MLPVPTTAASQVTTTAHTTVFFELKRKGRTNVPSSPNAAGIQFSAGADVWGVPSRGYSSPGV
jgi:hypothetical protein